MRVSLDELDFVYRMTNNKRLRLSNDVSMLLASKRSAIWWAWSMRALDRAMRIRRMFDYVQKLDWSRTQISPTGLGQRHATASHGSLSRCEIGGQIQ